MSRIKITLLFIVFTILPVFAANWNFVDDDVAIDMDNVQACSYRNENDNYYCFWEKTTKFDKELVNVIRKNYNKELSYMTNYTIINTDKKQCGLKSIVLYDKNGNTIYSYDYSDYKINFVNIV